MRTLLLIVYFSFIYATNLTAKNYFVSATATGTGDGSLGNPWKLQQALNAPTELTNPTDTVWVWLRDGKYTNNFDAQTSFSCFTNGKADAPIIFRNYDNERAIIDGQLPYTMSCVLGKCSFTWFWGLEFTNTSSADRDHPTADRKGNVYCTAEEMKFINLLIHDMGAGLDLWKTAKNSESYGCIIYNIGNNLKNGVNWEGHGHGMYLQNDTVGKKIIHNNIVFSTFGYGVKVWQTTTTSALGNFDIQGNVVFNGGSASENLGGVGNNSRTHNFFVVSNAPGNPVSNTVIKHNFTYSGTNTPRPPVNAFGLNYGVKNFVLDSNYLTGQTRLGFNNTPIFESSVKGNKIVPGIPAVYGYYLWGFAETDYTNNQYFSTNPSGLEYFVVPNKYETNRSHLVIYNWDSLDQVTIRLGSYGFKSGDTYKLNNAMDYFGIVDYGQVDIKNEIKVKMTGRSAAAAIGSKQAPVSQFPKFGVFVLTKTGNSGSGSVPSLATSELKIFPNPATGMFHIDLSEPITDVFELKVFDSRGDVVLSQKEFLSSSKVLEVDGRNWSDGIYWVHVFDGKGIRIGKITVLTK